MVQFYMLVNLTTHMHPGTGQHVIFTLLHNWIGFCHGQILMETATYFFIGGFSQCVVSACLGAFHPCPHATVTGSPWEGGTRQYIYWKSLICSVYLVSIPIPGAVAGPNGQLLSTLNFLDLRVQFR